MAQARGPQPDYGPRPLDLDTPNSARIYDCMLGGGHNTAADRELVQRIRAVAPRWVAGAPRNREFLAAAVHHLLDRGIRQFLDLGSGIPTVGNVHEIAQHADPTVRVVYVDYEAVAYHASLAMLRDNPHATILHADLRDPVSVLTHPETVELIDFTQPVGLLMIGVLLFIPDSDRPAEIIRAYRERLVPGSYLAISQVTTEGLEPDHTAELNRVAAAYQDADEQITFRGWDELLPWFDGTDLVPPGLARLLDWRGQESPLAGHDRAAACQAYAGIGRIR
ncbi:MAG TPA: SAM-dependent methyltransferase [Pseudonocardiaceae bacterium]|nr:SAM-dependent methyltransferase [Pseudonocardiaceae bacterium]